MRLVGTVLVALGGSYVGLCLLLFIFQGRLLHLPNVPGRELSATPAEVGLDYETISLRTADGIQLHGWFVLAWQPRGTLLFFHGNAGNISHRLESLLIFNRLGLNVLIFDYRGYGQSEGSASEEGLYLDAQAALNHLREQRGIPLRDMLFFGRSLGGAVAAWLAARHPPAGLIIESSFTSVPEMAAELYSWFPARLLTRLQYATANQLRRVNCPVLIIHSRDDEIIPFHHGQELFAAAPGPKQFLEIQGGHNEGFLLSQQRYQQGIADFLTVFKVLPVAAANPQETIE